MPFRFFISILVRLGKAGWYRVTKGRSFFFADMQVNSNTSLFNKHGKSGVGNLERTRIPTLSENKTEFQHWKATFTSCVDVFWSVQNVDICQDWRQYCLSDEALETIKGLRYSEAAYEAAKARLVRKYGGNRRKIQCHVKELLKMKPLRRRRKCPKKCKNLQTCWSRL